MEILHQPEYISSNYAQTKILLCQMKLLEVIRTIMDNNVVKIKAHFIHGYLSTAKVFYVLSIRYNGHEMLVPFATLLACNECILIHILNILKLETIIIQLRPNIVIAFPLDNFAFCCDLFYHV